MYIWALTSIEQKKTINLKFYHVTTEAGPLVGGKVG
jgi:hypothetical protein